MSDTSRRRFLTLASSASVIAIAGCSGLRDGGDEETMENGTMDDDTMDNETMDDDTMDDDTMDNETMDDDTMDNETMDDDSSDDV